MTPIEAAAEAYWKAIPDAFWNEEFDGPKDRLEDMEPERRELQLTCLQAAITAYESAQWHVLADDPQDLPDECAWKLVTDGDVTVMGQMFANESWYDLRGATIYNVEAWRELPLSPNT